MKRSLLFLVVLSIPMGFSATSQAETPSENRQGVIDSRQEQQGARIEKGEETGRLTDKEAQKLEKGQEKIDTMESKALEDGSMSRKETRKITKAQSKSSKSISRKNRNPDTQE
jgi:hypothetical protein